MQAQGISLPLRRLVLVSAILTYALIVFGGIVRTAGSGAGCPDWPLCHGRLIPPFELGVWIDWTHRLIASLVGLVVIASVAVAWLQLTVSHRVTRLLALSIPLLVLEGSLQGLAVIQDLPSQVVALHLTLSLIILALLLLSVVAAYRGSTAYRGRQHHPLYRWMVWATLAVYVLIITGAVVRGSSAGWACQGWPLCDGEILPRRGSLVLVNVIHRYLTAATGVLVIWLGYRACRERTLNPGARLWAGLAALVYFLEIVVGGLAVWLRFPVAVNALHLGLAATVWTCLVLSVAQADVVGVEEHTGVRLGEEAPRWRRTRQAQSAWRAYVGLMKPGIVALLLVTTVAGMIIAARGMPPWKTLLWVLLGSTLSAGGANTLNSHYDRDIDGMMSRTARRPLPQGRVSPERALVFGLLCISAGILVMALFVNLAAALITLVGAFWYSVVYTRWLKRATVQNIVIGGAAGAMAPVVGWVAITNHLDFLALVLFGLIFLWTPPHTWAFAMLVERDYAQVQIPMLPVVAGPRETGRQVLLYTWLLVGITLLPVVFRQLGMTYFLGMLVLNGLFLYLAYQMRAHPEKHLASRVYQYSNAYLYLTFALMAFDRMGGLLY